MMFSAVSRRTQVEPLGVLVGQISRDKLTPLIGAIPEGDRRPIAEYLRGGALVFAVMAYTRDKLFGRFGTTGGSSIRTDGRYYWRGDAGDYVETYGIGLPQSFLQHGSAAGWKAPTLSEADVLAIHAFLKERFVKN